MSRITLPLALAAAIAAGCNSKAPPAAVPPAAAPVPGSASKTLSPAEASGPAATPPKKPPAGATAEPAAPRATRPYLLRGSADAVEWDVGNYCLMVQQTARRPDDPPARIKGRVRWVTNNDTLRLEALDKPDDWQVDCRMAGAGDDKNALAALKAGDVVTVVGRPARGVRLENQRTVCSALTDVEIEPPAGLKPAKP